jgi:hypothetical protein
MIGDEYEHDLEGVRGPRLTADTTRLNWLLDLLKVDRTAIDKAIACCLDVIGDAATQKGTITIGTTLREKWKSSQKHMTPQSNTNEAAESSSAETLASKASEPTPPLLEHTKSRIQTVVTPGLAFQLLSARLPPDDLEKSLDKACR